MDHDGFVVLWHRVEGLLHDVATKSVHTKIQCISTDCIGNSNDLFGGAMFEAALNEEISKPVHHQRICLGYDRFDNFVLLLDSANFEFLLQENRGLLVIVAHDLVDYILPVASNGSVQQTTIVERLHRRNVRLRGQSRSLNGISKRLKIL